MLTFSAPRQSSPANQTRPTVSSRRQRHLLFVCLLGVFGVFWLKGCIAPIAPPCARCATDQDCDTGQRCAKDDKGDGYCENPGIYACLISRTPAPDASPGAGDKGSPENASTDKGPPDQAPPPDRLPSSPFTSGDVAGLKELLKLQVQLKSLAALSNAQRATLLALLKYIKVDTNTNLITFTGANVQLVNGMNKTASKNGLGNLIIGYNAARQSGTTERTGSHNLVVGDEHAYTSHGGFVAGFQNDLLAPYASVSGGIGNSASGDYASVSGGQGNGASGKASSVSGGEKNLASGEHASISGGMANGAIAKHSSISGGHENTTGSQDDPAAGQYTSISGGQNNTASGKHASISGGESNAAPGSWSSVSGGQNNTATGQHTSVSAGHLNNAIGQHANVSGGKENKAFGNDSSISGGHLNTTGDKNTPAAGEYASISGGQNNTASGRFASISGGESNTATGPWGPTVKKREILPGVLQGKPLNKTASSISQKPLPWT